MIWQPAPVDPLPDAYSEVGVYVDVDAAWLAQIGDHELFVYTFTHPERGPSYLWIIRNPDTGKRWYSAYERADGWPYKTVSGVKKAAVKFAVFELRAGQP